MRRTAGCQKVKLDVKLFYDNFKSAYPKLSSLAEMSKRNYLTLNCCEGDLCNGASDIRAKVVVMLGLILVARMF